MALERGRKPFERDPRIGDERDSAQLRGVEVGDVDVDVAHVRIAERRPGGSREV